MSKRLAITWLMLGVVALSSTVFVSSMSVANAKVEQISHEITSWNSDGTVTASVTMNLPDRIVGIQGIVTASVACGGAEICRSSDMTVEGDAQSGVTAKFDIALAPGENNLSISISGQDRHGTKISYNVDSHVISVPQPQPINVTYTGHEVGSRWYDGSADLILWFSIERADQWPLHAIEADVRCIDDHPCGSSKTLSLGWTGGSDDQSIYRTFLLVERIAQGERRFAANLVDGTIGWTGSVRDQTLNDVTASIPVAVNPNVELVGYELFGYDEDLRVNASVEFSIAGPTDWPISSIRARLECQDEVSCETEEVFTPDWIEDSTATEHRWKTTINGLTTGFARLTATFEAEQDVWFGAPRVTVLDDIVLDLLDQSSYNVRWSATSADVQGYYMDGSASVNLTLTATQLGTKATVSDEITAVCYTVSDESAEDCQTVEPAVAVEIGTEGGTVNLSGLRLPQGATALKIVAGNASSELTVTVEERIVGFSRGMWECFIDSTRSEDFANRTCSGFTEQYVRKWTLNTVNVYREGDPSYIEVFDSSLDYFHHLTGIEYVIVDDVETAHVEAYVGHTGNPRVTEVIWERCAESFRCERAYSSTGDAHAVDRGALSLKHWADFTPGDMSSTEDGVRFNVIDQLRHVLIPVERSARPMLLGLANRPDFIRPHDKPMYRLIYSANARLGMPFADLREYVVLNDETLDYEPTLPEPDIVAYKVAREHFEADSISVDMIGMDVRGSVYYPGSEIRVEYADFERFQSNRAKFSSENWSSIIFGWDEETWSSAGGRWTISEEHGGRGRNYRSTVNFDFILADPTRMLYEYTYVADRIDVARHQNDLLKYTVRHHPEAENWPIPTFEIVIDADTYVMQSYTMQWHFDAEDRVRLPYSVEADVVEYGGEFEIPDEVRENSLYLANLE